MKRKKNLILMGLLNDHMAGHALRKGGMLIACVCVGKREKSRGHMGDTL